MIKNIIFDYGGVLLHLLPKRTIEAFKALSPSSAAYETWLQALEEKEHFNKMERGEISDAAFLEGIAAYLPSGTPLPAIREAWSAMLMDLPAERLTLLRDLKAKGYRLFLLSNTNHIHLTDLRVKIEEMHGTVDFESYFDRAYYSHEIGYRKPDLACFEWVLQDAAITAEESLFIDDNAENIRAAASIGIQTALHPANVDLREAVKQYLQRDDI